MADAGFEQRARYLARTTVDEMQNRGIGLSFEEAQSVAAAINSDIATGFCTRCGYEIQDLTQTQCAKCGNTKAQETPVFICARCNHPVDAGMVGCPSCGNKTMIRANPKSRPLKPREGSFSCADCLAEVVISQPSCSSCGSTRAYKNVEV